MTAYCSQKWHLYRLWSNALRARDARMAAEFKRSHDAHLSTCLTCRAHFDAMTTQASKAVMPEFEEE